MATLLYQDDTVFATGIIQGTDGAFSFSSLPLSPELTALQVSITLDDGVQSVSATVSNQNPVPDGVTDAGTLVLIPGG